MEHYLCKNIYLTSLEIKNNLRTMLQNNYNAVECSVLNAAINIISSLESELVKLNTEVGWHPASKLPEKPTSKLGRIVILTLEGKLNFNYYVDGWDMSNVKRWCYPPKEED